MAAALGRRPHPAGTPATEFALCRAEPLEVVVCLVRRPLASLPAPDALACLAILNFP